MNYPGLGSLSTFYLANENHFSMEISFGVLGILPNSLVEGHNGSVKVCLDCDTRFLDSSDHYRSSGPMP